MKRIFTILAFFFIFFTPTVLWSATCTWTGSVNSDWNNAGNWSGGIPTSSDDAVFSAFTLVSTTSSIVINSLSLTDGISLMKAPTLNSVTFSTPTITYNSTTNGGFTSSISGFSTVMVSAVTLNAPNPNFITLELENAILNGAVNTNAQALKLKGNTILNTGCSFSGGILSGNGVEFSSNGVTVNTGVSISSSARFSGGVFVGTGSFTLGNGAIFFGGALMPTIIGVPVTINNTLSGANALNCSNIVFTNTVTLNASLGDLYVGTVGNLLQPLEFQGVINSNKSFLIQNGGSLVKFTNATLNIDGTTFGMGVTGDAVITNSTFNDNVTFSGNAQFLSGTFNSRLDIRSVGLPAKIFTIKAGGAKSILGLTEIAGTLNWESGVITKNSATQIIVDAGAMFNISTADGFSTGFDGQLTNDGTINYTCITPSSNLLVSMRTWNRSTGVINVGNSGIVSQLTLSSYQNDGSMMVQMNAYLNLGGENHAHFQNGTITGTGNLVFSLGNHNLSTNFSSGTLVGINCLGGYYFSGSGSITSTASTRLQMIGGWTTIPITINGLGRLYQTPKLTNTMTVNGVLEWNTPNLIFGTNGKFNIGASGTALLNTAGNATLETNATNTGITNCGSILCNENVNFDVDYIDCTPSAIRGSGKLTLKSTFILHQGSPGKSPGTLFINPSITSASDAVYEMEITGGYGAVGIADDADRVESDGNIVLNGTLKVLLVSTIISSNSNIIPEVGMYTIIKSNHGTVTGSFSSILFFYNGKPIPQPAGLNIIYNTSDVQVFISQVLSVELLSFEAKNTEGGNLLTWQTAHEINTSHFDIERSADGIKFEKIGALKAQNKAAKYQFIDNQTSARFQTSPTLITYYHLKINDLDGKSTVSKIISIEKNSGNSIKIHRDTEGSILIETNSRIESIILTNTIGQTIKVIKDTHFLINDLAAGIYIISVKTDNGFLSQKIFKQ